MTRAMRTKWRVSGAFLTAIVLTGAYAPLLASNLPYVSWVEDRSGWSLPAFRMLSVADWLWLLGPVMGAVLLVKWRRQRKRESASMNHIMVLLCGCAVLPLGMSVLRWWGGDAWYLSLKTQHFAWWVGIFITAVTGTALLASPIRWCSSHNVMSLCLAGIGAMLLCCVCARVATVDRPALMSAEAFASAHAIHPPAPNGWADVAIEDGLLAPGARDADGSIHLLGTDDVGGDVLARLMHGCRIAVTVGVLAAGLAMIVGIMFGVLMGYFGGAIDLIGMRIVELVMAVPRLFLILAVVVFLPTRDSAVMLTVLILVIGFTGWMRPSRLLRAEVLRVRGSEYVLAARACGVSTASVLGRHILPNTIGPVLVDGGFAVAAAILMETNLSFLGLGVQPPQPSWGGMLAQSIDLATGGFHWWLAIGPGVLIAGTVLACNTLAEAARLRLSRSAP